MNAKSFYDSIRITLFKGSLSAIQVKGIEAILAEYHRLAINDLHKLAYILATAYHETAYRMYPVEEYGRGKNYAYGRKIKMSRLPYTTPDKLYYGRGHVQLTWYENYQAMGKLLGVDLLNKPELALDLSISVQILFQGMIRGMFTGRKLADYFSATKRDPYNARRIVNGIDKAVTIQKYYKLFYNALTLQ